jgi:16S rRNA (cytosine967-C5)-methyltransferase
MASPARHAAYRVVREVNERRADLPSALARIRSGLVDQRDQALATEIASGTFRWLAALDHLVTEFSGRSTKRLEPEVLDILRIGAYQLLHLERVPASAVVDESVKLTRRVGKSSAAGLVNAVLRRISRQRKNLPLPGADRPLDYLSVTYSHPRWLAARWLERYGFEAAEKWVIFNNTPPPLALRVNTLKATRERLIEMLGDHGVEAVPSRFAPDGLVVRHGNPLKTPLMSQGLFLVQDEASQLVPWLTEVRPGERVLDACASPGGKTTALSAAMNGSGLLVAADVRDRRLALLRRTVALAGTRNVRLVQLDVEMGLPFGSVFDRVLLDVPCSGLGTIRRDPDIRWRRSEQELGRLAEAERRMIRSAAEAVRPGGRIVYATCSSEPEENEQVVDWFLESDTRFVLEGPEAFAGLTASVRAAMDERGMLRTTPHRHGLEAFFAAAIRRLRP